MPHSLLVLVGGEFYWLKVWQGQVNRGSGYCCHFVVLGFSGLKATLALKGRISWLWVDGLKHSEFCGS
ncbi:hypothetical protein VB548_12185 [Vibrio parahaemolyticus]|uniref:hypothetical protein n=1 Tax=Vibrio parahaemolyticus TaxID=670 RepID=UPI002B216B81|nr:hypothetical protein [Vibrio parahaemolyticus]MEA5307074.1 hypothetical protein [Vibrio parahaemolyticus]